MTPQNTTGPATAAAPVLVRRAGPADAEFVRTLLLELAADEQSTHAVRSPVGHRRRMLADPAVVVLLADLDGRPVRSDLSRGACPRVVAAVTSNGLSPPRGGERSR